MMHWTLLAIVLVVLGWSAIGPADRMTWWLEVAPAIAGILIIAAVWKRFKFTDLVLALIAAHMVILIIGGHYTYAEVPAFNWLRDEFDLARNHYDRLGHLFQGFVPAMIAREVLIRNGVVARRGWLGFLCVTIALSISAFYEMIEWWVALLSDTAAESFLGTQGDHWDTQWDMFCALIGAAAAMVTLSRVHDRQLERG